jgi:Fe-S-cluster-containing hydrogenase component 2
MGKKLLIDLQKLREYKSIPVEGILEQDAHGTGFRTIRELATFQFTCRRCEKAPCVEACPVKALEKAGNDVVKRAILLCVRCKSCVFICPFGTLMDNLFEAKTSGRKFMALNSDDDLQKFAESFPGEVIRIVDREENPEENIFSLSERVLIKENTWQ